MGEEEDGGVGWCGEEDEAGFVQRGYGQAIVSAGGSDGGVERGKLVTEMGRESISVPVRIVTLVVP